MPGGNKNIRGSDNTNGFQKNPQNINKKGVPKIRPLRDMLNELGDKEFTITVPIKNCDVDTDNGVVRIKLPSKKVIALSLQKNAGKNVRWFAEWAKVMGEYAPTNHNIFNSGKEITGITFEDETS